MKNYKKIWSINIGVNGNLIGILEFDTIKKYGKYYSIEYRGYTSMILPIESIKGKLKKSFGCNGINEKGYDVRGYHLDV